MTVAAVILYHSPEGPLADANGRVAARRIVESAWAGGATPIVVVAFDPTGALAAALAGSPAVLAEPAPVENGPVAQIARGIDVAAALVTETDAALVWPGRLVWVDAETVGSLIEGHGPRRESILRPSYGDAAGWPALVPMTVLPLLRAQASHLMPDEILAATAAAGVRLELIDTGDPGVIHDISTPFESLPTFEGPPEPAGGASPEWGAAAAEMPDDAPLEGPALAPYAQASDEG
ncbi:MAG: NTP transferase domain-containing protein [Chloroflexota bacterium]